MSDAFQNKTIGFSNGDVLTFDQAANLIEQEGQLALGPYIHKSMRCATGVLENHEVCQKCLELMNSTAQVYCYHPLRKRCMENIWFAVCLSTENNKGVGFTLEKPEDRCGRIVTWLRK